MSPSSFGCDPNRPGASTATWLLITINAESPEQALLPPSVALLHRKDSHERFHCVDFAVVDLKRFPHRELVTAALAHAPSHTQPDDAHALIDGDDARLHVTKAIEDRE